MIHDLETLPNHTTLISKIPANLNVSSLKEPMNGLLKWHMYRQKKEKREG